MVVTLVCDEKRAGVHPDPAPIWRKRFYDFNVRIEEKQIEKLRYIHRNRWSSDWWGSNRSGAAFVLIFSFYQKGRIGAGEISGVPFSCGADTPVRCL
jgi:hypothetical protein